MNFVEFLDTLANTLDDIEVHGRENVNLMAVCFSAIEQMRDSIMNMPQRMKPDEEKPEEQQEPVVGGEKDG